MPVFKPSKFASPLRTATRCAGTTVAAIGIIVLLGWAFDLTAVQSLVSGLPTMKANTAACFLLAAISLLYWQHQGTAVQATVCAALVTLVALVTWCEYAFQWNTGLDQILFRVPIPTDLAAPGRMSEATAIGFLLVGIALLLLNGGERATGAAQTIGATVIGLGVLVLLAFAYGADMKKTGPFSSVALHTAASFLVLGIGLLTVHGLKGWVHVFTEDSVSSKLGRRILLSALMVLPVIATLRIYGQRNLGWYDTYFGIALLIVSSLTVLSIMIWLATRSGNAADWKVEKLMRVNATLSGINTLIVRAVDKENLYWEACEIANDKGHFPWVWIATREADESQVFLRATCGSNAQLEALLRARLEEINSESTTESWMARVMRTQEPIIIENMGADRSNWNTSSVAFAPTILRHGMLSGAMLPLVVDGKSVGVISFHAQRAGFFDVAEMVVLRELAGDISFAIKHIEKSEYLNYISNYNTLTGLPNRTLFEDRLARELQAADRVSHKVALVVGDIRRFRHVNEALGRTAGDELLRQFAQRLNQHMRFPDNLANFGADTFASFLPNYEVADGNHMQSVMAAATDEHYVIGGQTISVQTTLGVAIHPEDGKSVEELLRNAEVALKQGKEHGDAVRFYQSQMNAAVAESLILENKLRKALELGQFVLHYQPKVGFLDRTIHSVEALIRWNDPETGVVPPGKFIPLLEETGLIREVGDWALRRAVEDMQRWQAMGLQSPRCAVNVSAVQLRDDTFSDSVIQVMRSFGDAPCLLDIEITESLVMENVAHTTAELRKVMEHGIKISVDDFGTGFSSLAYLAKLPIHTLKIDRAFIMDLESDEHSRSIVLSIISLAHNLELDVVAEGVETEGQATLLREMGCDLMQGFLFSKAVPFDALAQMLPRQAAEAAEL